MIRNIVFDLGQVLLSYDPRKYLEKLHPDPNRRELLWEFCNFIRFLHIHQNLV
jgi:hypothetical protein